jgi:DMSO/TMAO reductase YedYZ heme-binding membrane subunit
MSRSPWLDQVFGQDHITDAHRWVGFGAIWLLVGHAIFTTIGYGMGIGASPVAEFVTLLTTYPYVLWSAAGLVIFMAVGITSVRAVRRRASYETWYAIHLYTYLAIALAFLHQLFVGVDFTTDRLASLYWIFCTSWPSARSGSSGSASPSLSRGGTGSTSPTWSRRHPEWHRST